MNLRHRMLRLGAHHRPRRALQRRVLIPAERLQLVAPPGASRPRSPGPVFPVSTATLISGPPALPQFATFRRSRQTPEPGRSGDARTGQCIRGPISPRQPSRTRQNTRSLPDTQVNRPVPVTLDQFGVAEVHHDGSGQTRPRVSEAEAKEHQVPCRVQGQVHRLAGRQLAPLAAADLRR